MSKFYLNLVMLVAVVLVAVFVANAQAEVLCNFENGAADYDNNSTQTTGKFRDNRDYYIGTSPEPSAYVNLSNNGTANDYLTMYALWGGAAPGAVYDTTPGNTSPYTVFKTPVGITTTVTVDATLDAFLGTSMAGLSIFDPAASASGNRGFSLQYLDYTSGTTDKVRGLCLTAENTFGSNYIIPLADTTKDLTQPLLRLSISLLNNGTSATVTCRVDKIDALEGNLIDDGNIYNSGAITLDYGTGSNQLNMNPATNGFEVVLTRNVVAKNAGNPPAGGGTVDYGRVYFDHLTLTTVPEPSTLALLAAGLVGLLAYAWRKRK